MGSDSLSGGEVLLQREQNAEDDFLVFESWTEQFDEVPLKQFPMPALFIGERIELRASHGHGRRHSGNLLYQSYAFRTLRRCRLQSGL
jgi:hypothetical protein